MIMEIISQKQEQNQKIKIRPLSEEQNSVTLCPCGLHGEGAPVACISCLCLSPEAELRIELQNSFKGKGTSVVNQAKIS